jgi:hypothetical protein
MINGRHSRRRRAHGPAGSRRRGWWLAPLAVALLLGTVAATPGPDSTAGDTNITGSVKLPAPGSREVIPAVPNPIRVGESLKFNVQYGIVNAGNAWLEVPEVSEIEGRQVLHLVARAESNGFISRFFKVRNRIESMWDKKGRYSWRYTENRREGKYRANNVIQFDHGRAQATYKNGETYPIPPQVQDALSSFYYTRTQALPLGGSIVFDYHASRKSVPLEVKVLGRERVSTPAGKFDCVVIEPKLKAGGIFKNNGRLVIWLTEDERRMPVMMKSKVAIGSISVVLAEAKS